MVRIRIKLLRRVNRTAEIGSKKLIKRQFESDLKLILALGWLNRISLELRDRDWNWFYDKGIWAVGALEVSLGELFD